MRITANDAMKAFLDANPVYPFTEIRKSRNTLEVKYVLLKQHEEHTVYNSYYSPLLASCLPSSMLQQLIVEGKALPLTKEMDYLLYEMIV